MRATDFTCDQRGFTIIEVMVAAVVLLVGILGVATIVNTSNATTTSNKAREQGLALAREIIESARSVRYQALRPDNAVATVQAMPGLGNAGAGSGWTIRRRGIVYSVSLGVCSVDDAGDGTGAHVSGAFCARPTVAATADTCKNLIGSPAKINGTGGGGLDAADCGIDGNLDGQVDGLLQTTATACPSGTSVEAGTCDAQPDDFKRLVVLVTWDRGSGSRFVLQQATESFPGLSAYAAITRVELQGAGPAPSDGYVVRPSATGVNPSSLTFEADSSEPANQVDWLLDGTDMGLATWSGSTGTFTWNLGNDAPASETARAEGEVVDGSYTVGARVQDAGGIHGAELDTTVTLNRRIPFPPQHLSATIDAGGTVTATWVAPADQDIVGYRLYWQNGSGSNYVTCTASPCTHTPSSAPTTNYWVKALDRDPVSGANREGQSSNVVPVSTGNSASPPPAPASLSLGTAAANGGRVWVTLTWPAVSFSPAVTDYAIYRDSTATPWATVQASNGATYTEKIKSSETHDYWVAAIAGGITGPKVGPVHYPAP
ncbi:MAG TPA: fibronectin type III domain-containing protein [Baekduia sp.]|nr:fibronectin type III domain-containing protein [Baekduia sp.]